MIKQLFICVLLIQSVIAFGQEEVKSPSNDEIKTNGIYVGDLNDGEKLAYRFYEIEDDSGEGNVLSIRSSESIAEIMKLLDFDKWTDDYDVGVYTTVDAEGTIQFTLVDNREGNTRGIVEIDGIYLDVSLEFTDTGISKEHLMMFVEFSD